MEFVVLEYVPLNHAVYMAILDVDIHAIFLEGEGKSR